jgi:hypothetical protein
LDLHLQGHGPDFEAIPVLVVLVESPNLNGEFVDCEVRRRAFPLGFVLCCSQSSRREEGERLTVLIGPLSSTSSEGS